MSCQIKGIANLADAHNVKELLFADSPGKLDHIPDNELPLQDCLLSLSSAGDVLAMAWNTKLIILVSKWDSQSTAEVKNKFHVAWFGEIAKQQNEWITSVICLPLISFGITSAGSGPDWTCVAVGLNNGFLKFYTETGALLLEEQLCTGPIIGIKCQAFSVPRFAGDTGLSEEVYVIYNSAVCVLQGFSLCSTLRACRNHLAKVRANCTNLPPVANLVYKTWRVSGIVQDLEVIGTTSVNNFDHLMTASTCGGYNATYRSSAPQHTLAIVVGINTFLRFYYLLEGGVAPVLSDVAAAMASYVVDFIGSAVPWFRGNPKNAPMSDVSKSNTQVSVEIMTMRYCFREPRECDFIVTSPNKVLSVVMDTMGRVMLLNNKRGTVIRMWKGYRDAQCGWIQVDEERHRRVHKNQNNKSHSTSLRTALFLVIYAPKKGVIDIWGMQHGPKITTFTASKNGRLLYINYGLLGLNDTSYLLKNTPQYGCVFMDPLGGLKEITVPFHFALNSNDGKRARDIHILKKLKTFLREEEFDDEKLITEVTNACLDIKTTDVKIEMIEMLMNNKHITPSALLVAINCFATKREELEAEEAVSKTSSVETVYQLTTQLQRLINFYNYIITEFNTPPEYSTVTSNDESHTKGLSLMLLTSDREIHRILKLSKMLKDFEHVNVKNESKVKFKDNGRVFVEFLSCFDFDASQTIGLRKDISLDRKYQISQLICQGWIYSNDAIDVWTKATSDCEIQPFVLMQFALTYWLYKRRGACLQVEIKRFSQLIHGICLLGNLSEICPEDNEVSSWWRNVRNILTESTNPFNALTAALACRAVGVNLEKYKEQASQNSFHEDNRNEGEDSQKGNEEEKVQKFSEKELNLTPEDETYSLTSEWENVSKDTCQFSLLISNLEDVSVLDAIVSRQPPSDHTTPFFSVPFEKSDISLSIILSKGKGAVTEIVAKWLSSAGLLPAKLIDTTDVEFEQTEQSVDSMQMAGSLEEACTTSSLLQQDEVNLLSMSVEIGNEVQIETTAEACILDHMSLLKRHFPYSLTSSTLLANLCWEYAMSWNKEISQLEAFEAALTVLRHIPMTYVKYGVCSLLWTVHVKKRLETVAKLMNKLGKLPREKLCMQDIGLSDIQTTLFLQYCVTFLDIFYDTDNEMKAARTPVMKTEQLWEGYTSSPQPFVVLAISQTRPGVEQITLHLAVANILHMMARFNMKVKPLNVLFNSIVSEQLFQDITIHVNFSTAGNEVLKQLQTEFLCKVITASMDCIHQETSDGKTLNSAEAILWMAKCEQLASLWQINTDELRIHQVCRLYINGFDRLAEEIFAAVNDTEELAERLLPIAGRRILSQPEMYNLTEDTEVLSRISPPLLEFLNGLKASYPKEECVLPSTNYSKDDIVELICRVLTHLPQTHQHYLFAQLMLDSIFP